MPRVKPLTVMDQREIEIRREIGAIMGELMISQKELAERAGMTPATLSARLSKDGIGDMRLSEYWAIQDAARRGV
jgi:predicted transcriptional regulator